MNPRMIPLVVLTIFSLFFHSCRPKTERAASLVKVEVAPPVEREFRRWIRVEGNVEPNDYAAICARVDGVLDNLYVDKGDCVVENAVLFQSDKVNLENAVTIASQNLKVAETQMMQANILLEVQKVKLENSVLDLNRAKTLRNKDVLSTGSMEDIELQWKKDVADVRQAEAGVDLAKVLVEQAQSNLRISQKKLEDSIIRSPYAGIVTHSEKKLGEYAKSGDCVLRIEKPEPLVVSILLSSIYYPLIKKDKTPAVVCTLSGEKLADAVVTYRAPSIDPLSRTFEIEIELPSDGRFVSGMLCSVELVFSEETGLGVPSEAVLPRGGEKQVVFLAKDGKAESVEIPKLLSDRGYTEVPETLKGVPIIVKGQAFLNPGTPIQVVEEPKSAPGVTHVSQ